MMSPTPPSSKTPIDNASFGARALNRVQMWALQHPGNFLAKLLLLLIGLIEGLLANNPTYLDRKRLVFGPNFCCAGEVVMGEFATLEKALTSPQARTWRLGTSMLDSHHLPMVDGGGRNVFLLALSGREAGGNGDFEAFLQCMWDYMFNQAAQDRQQDAIATQLLEQLTADYQDMPHDAGGTFFTDTSRGLMRFLVRYLHYVLFGLDPNNKEMMDLFTKLYYIRQGTVYYFAGLGTLLMKILPFYFGVWPKLVQEVATIYESSPALAGFKAGESKYHNMTQRELAMLMTSIMSIAALQGPLHLAYTAMGYRSLPAYEGHNMAEIDPTQTWDQLDLSDRDAVKRYLLECARLWMPVSASHRVAVEPFTVKIEAKEQTFPAGTVVLIPMILGMLDQNFWGPTTYEFNPDRENLCPYSMAFNAVGDRTHEPHGRICPGKDIALTMLIDILSTLGKVRRS